MSKWKIEKNNKEIVCQSDALSFRMTTGWGIADACWPQADLATERLNLQVFTGDYYSCNSFNQLNCSLPAEESSCQNWKVKGDLLKIKLYINVNDLKISRSIHANALSGELEVTDCISKNGPGKTCLQVNLCYHPE